MQQNFKELLSTMLADLDKGKSVEDIIASKMQEAQLSEESQAKVNEAVAFVGKIDAASASLRAATQRGASRQEWLSDHVEDLIGRLPEDMQGDAAKLMGEITQKAMANL